MTSKHNRAIVWVKYGNLDTGLDRATWLETGRALREQGYDVTLVTAFERTPQDFPGWKPGAIKWIPEVPVRFLRLLAFDIRAWAVVARRCLTRPPRFLILSVPTFACAFPFDLLARLGLPGPKTVIDLRTFEFGGERDTVRLKDRALRLMARIAFAYGRAFQSGITAINPRLGKAAVQMGAHPRVGIWGSGWSAPAGTPFGGQQERDFHARAKNRFVVMYHGVMHQNRGLMEALEGFGLALKQRSDLMLVFLGDGPLVGDLRGRVAELGLSQDCLVLPPVASANVYEYLAAADLGCTVYPNIRYWDYNHPIKVAEYLSQGVPVLCSRIPMFIENYADCEALVYCDAATPEAIAEALVWCFDHPEDMRKKSAAAKAFASGLRWSRQAERLAEFLETL